MPDGSRLRHGWHCRPSTNRRSARGGLSLLELLVVIGILSVMAMVSWPMLQRPLNRSVLQDAGQQLQRALAEARFYAMESGKPVFFQYQANSGRYWLGENPANPENTNSESDQLALGEITDSATIHSSQEGNKAERANARIPRLPGQWGACELPDQVVFAAGLFDETQSESSESEGEIGQTTPHPDEELAGKSMAESPEWSFPVTFYPGGRIVPGRLHLSSADGYQIEVEIQGLAGRIKVFPPHR